MKRCYLKFLAGTIIAAMSLNAMAQDEIVELMKAGVKDDANVLMKEYIRPLGTGFAAGLGANWYNTAAPHKLLGFDITVSVNGAMIPSSAKSFEVSNSMFSLLKLTSGTTATTPTLSGEEKEGPEVRAVIPSTNTTIKYTNPLTGLTESKIVTVPEKEIAKFKLPQGVPALSFVPTPTLQLGVGLPFRTEIMFRYVPNIKAGDFKVGLWGLGIKHDFKQWIPVIAELPFDASFIAGYTSFKTSYGLSLLPKDLMGDQIVDLSTASTWDGQEFQLNSSAFTANVAVSKKLLFFTPYLGFGITSSKFQVKMAGTYPVAQLITDPNDPDFAKTYTTNINPNTGEVDVTFKPVVRNGSKNMVDPIDFTISEFMPNLTVGFRLKILWVLALHAQYTVQKYPIATAGFGINIR